jgi:DNA-binding MarR family transcriptional regulator
MKEILHDKDYSLWMLLAETKLALFKAREKKIGHYVHSNQASILVIIWSHEGQATTSMLSKAVSREIHTVSGLISRMEKRGLIIKSKDPVRKNITRLAVTEKGREMAKEVIQIDFVRKIISSLSEDQKAQLRPCLSILLKAAQNEMRIEDGSLR